VKKDGRSCEQCREVVIEGWETIKYSDIVTGFHVEGKRIKRSELKVSHEWIVKWRIILRNNTNTATKTETKLRSKQSKVRSTNARLELGEPCVTLVYYIQSVESENPLAMREFWCSSHPISF
jgi:hypothetical protein